jgi:hypothetical protein
VCSMDHPDADIFDANMHRSPVAVSVKGAAA